MVMVVGALVAAQPSCPTTWHRGELTGAAASQAGHAHIARASHLLDKADQRRRAGGRRLDSSSAGARRFCVSVLHRLVHAQLNEVSCC